MFEVRVGRRAERGLRRIREGDPRGFRRVAVAIRSLAHEPRPTGAVKLTAVDPPAWRLRVGDYRVVYEIHEQQVVVIVVSVAPRGEVYR